MTNINNINFRFPSINTHVNNITKTKCQTDRNNTKFNTGQPVQDVFVPSSQKIENKVNEKEVTELYNKIYNQCKSELSSSYGGIKIEKPKFIITDEVESPSYVLNDNTISFPKKMLNGICLINKEPGMIWEKTADGFNESYAERWATNKNVAQEMMNENNDCKPATKDETMAIIASALRHEMEHCAQMQCSLCIDGALEDFLISDAKEYGISKEDMQIPEIKEKLTAAAKKAYPFLFSYKPSIKIDENSNITKFAPLKLNFEDFKNDTLQATKSLSTKDYYANTNEILAREAESDFWSNDAKKFFPNISDEFIETQKTATDLNKLNGVLAKLKPEQ